jgi:glycosyltransferase involved in cell wall biosynthesis
MYRKPLVASRVGGISDVIEDGATGLLVPEKDPQALADANVKVLSDRGLAKRLGEAGYAHVKRKFDWEVITRDMVELYRQVGDTTPNTPVEHTT